MPYPAALLTLLIRPSQNSRYYCSTLYYDYVETIVASVPRTLFRL
jgi:hypothetical protein